MEVGLETHGNIGVEWHGGNVERKSPNFKLPRALEYDESEIENSHGWKLFLECLAMEVYNVYK